MKCDLLIDNVNLATMQDSDQPYGAIANACLAITEGKILYAGLSANCEYESAMRIDGRGGWITPGLIDCHTHLVFGGNRAQEFEQRLEGVSYEEIARRGGGIKSTVKATRSSSHEDLLKSALKRVATLMSEGVTTIEVKSGYGLDKENELKMLQVARQISQHLPVNIRTTFLGAHTVPVEYQDNGDGYIEMLCSEVLPEVVKENLADAVDVFCESIGFNTQQTRRLFEAAKAHSLPIKAHVEQLSDLKGALLAAEFDALSVDHLEYLNPDDVPALKQSGTVAVMLPGAFYFLKESQKPPIEAIREHQVPMAVATDLNPGSSPMASLLGAMNMACVLFGLTPEEALAGTTRNAALALGLSNKGRLQSGYDADLCLWDINHPSELAYGLSLVKPEQVWIGGKHV